MTFQKNRCPPRKKCLRPAEIPGVCNSVGQTKKPGIHCSNCQWDGVPQTQSEFPPLNFSIQKSWRSKESKKIKCVTDVLCHWWSRNMHNCCFDNIGIHIYESSLVSENLIELEPLSAKVKTCQTIFLFHLDPESGRCKLRGCITQDLFYCMKSCRGIKHISDSNDLLPCIPRNVSSMTSSKNLQQCWIVESGKPSKFATANYKLPEFYLPYCISAFLNYHSNKKEMVLQLDMDVSWRVILQLELVKKMEELNIHGKPSDSFMTNVEEILRQTNTISYFTDPSKFKEERQSVISIKAACAFLPSDECKEYRKTFSKAESILTRFKFRCLYCAEETIVRSLEFANDHKDIVKLTLSEAQAESPSCLKELRTHYHKHYSNCAPMPKYIFKIPFKLGWMYIDGCPLCSGVCPGLSLHKGYLYVGYMELPYVLEELCMNETHRFFCQTELSVNQIANVREAIGPEACDYLSFVQISITSMVASYRSYDSKTSIFGNTAASVDWENISKNMGYKCEKKKLIEYIKAHFPPCMTAIVLREFPVYMKDMGPYLKRGNHPCNQERLSLKQFLAQIDERLMDFNTKKEVFYVSYKKDYGKDGVNAKKFKEFYDTENEAKQFEKYMKQNSGIKLRMMTKEQKDELKLRSCSAAIENHLCPFSLAKEPMDHKFLFMSDIDSSSCTMDIEDLRKESKTWSEDIKTPRTDIKKMCNRGCSLYFATRKHRDVDISAANRPIYSPISYFERSMLAKPKIDIAFENNKNESIF